MGKYYESEESQWTEEVKKHEKMADGIEMMLHLDECLGWAFQILEEDKYGLMSRKSYSSMRGQIKKLEEDNEDLLRYARGIHDVVAEKDYDFYKDLNSSIENLSLLDINKYTTKNTLGIKETKTTQITYMPTSMSQSQVGTYQKREVLKDRINLTDILLQCDTFGYTKQLEAYLKKDGQKYTQAELVNLKKKFYGEYLTTSFEHEAYAPEWKKTTSKILDYVPIVGESRT